MITIRGAAVVAALTLLLGPDAGAQSAPVVTLVPSGWARWDVAGHAGRQGVNKPGVGPEWDGWYQSASYAASVGRFVTRNIKLEIDATRSARADLFTSGTVTAGADYFYRSQMHHFTTTAVSAGAVYQAFENQWVHPFAGGGLEVMRETQISDASQQGPLFRNGIAIPMPVNWALPAAEVRSTAIRPFVTAGVKVYVSSHAFLRTDLRVGLSRSGAESAVWRAGVGVDF
jgi:hypothetical protein